jgi:hypothetical protein
MLCLSVPFSVWRGGSLELVVNEWAIVHDFCGGGGYPFQSRSVPQSDGHDGGRFWIICVATLGMAFFPGRG